MLARLMGGTSSKSEAVKNCRLALEPLYAPLSSRWSPGEIPHQLGVTAKSTQLTTLSGDLLKHSVCVCVF